MAGLGVSCAEGEGAGAGGTGGWRGWYLKDASQAVEELAGQAIRRQSNEF